MRKMNISQSAGLKKKSSHCNVHHLGACRRCNYPKTSWGPTPVPADENGAQTTKQHRFSPEFLQSVWPKFHQPPTTLVEMNVEETAIWVEMIAKFKGWEEAKSYAHSFKTNEVTGYVLPYFSVQALRSELEIVKFGHRLEIMSAIENSELTLMNPIIVSLRPNAFLVQSVKTLATSNANPSPRSNSAQLRNPWKKPNKHAKEVNKWLSDKPKNPWLSTNAMNFGEVKSGAMYSGADWISDPDLYGLRMFEETGSWNSKSASYNKMIRGVGTKRGKSIMGSGSISGGKYQWIPPIELPPSMMKFDERESDEGRLSTIFKNAKPGATTACGEQAQNYCWSGIVAEAVKREIK